MEYFQLTNQPTAERMQACCFTGNRPQKLAWGFNENDERCKAIKVKMKEQLTRAINNGYRHFISGMALGGDTYFAEAVLELKKTYDIILEAAIPCMGQENSWNSDNRDRYRNIIKQCDYATVISENYTNFCMHKRNRYMIDRCSLVFTLDGGRSGGTQNTINYASKSGKVEIVNLL